MSWLEDQIGKIYGHDGRKRLFSNVLALSALQAANYIVPLITIPYLVRVLGAERFGLVMFAAAFNLYFVTLTDFGFDLSATRAVAVNREHPERISEIFSSVMMIKSGFVVLGFAILCGLVFSIGHFRSDYAIYLLSYGVTVGQAYFPTWFFQGMEQMKLITILNVTAKSVFAILLLLVVRKPDDYIYVPVMNSMGFLTAAIISAFLVTKKFGVRLILPALSILGDRLRESSHFFFSRVAVSMYDNSNTFIVGLVLGNVSAGYYSAAEKLFKAMTALNMPLTNSLYPYMAKSRDIRTYRKIFSIATTANVVFCLLVFLFAYQIVALIYGSGLEQTATLLRFFAILACLMIPSVLLGYPLLAAMGHPNYANYSVVAAACVHVLMLLAAIPVLSVKLVVVLLIITQLIVLTIRLVGVRKHLSGVLTA